MKKIIITSCLFTLVNMGCKTSSVTKVESSLGRETVLKLDPGPNNPRNSEGAFITLNDGRILFVFTHYNGKSGSDWGDADLASRYSSDNGRTWSSENKIEVKPEGSKNVMSVSLVRLPDSSIALFYLRVGGPFSCTPYMRISTDEGNTWEEPRKCITDRNGYFQVNNDRVILLESGRLLMPIVQHRFPNQKWDSIASKGIIWNFWSDDMGKTWKSGENVRYPTDVHSWITMQEPGIVKLKNKNILMYCRTNFHSQFLSLSKDNGETWTDLISSNIKSPNSPALIKRIPSTGDLIMVWNNNGENQERTPLSIAISRDEGKSWKKIKNIEDDPKNSFSYPAIHFVDNHILVAYCANGLSSLYITRLSLDWVYK